MPVTEKAHAAGLGVRTVIRRDGERSTKLRELETETVLGFPTVLHTRAKRLWVGIRRQPQIQLQLRDLKRKVAALQCTAGLKLTLATS
jgi:hypothetical protein